QVYRLQEQQPVLFPQFEVLTPERRRNVHHAAPVLQRYEISTEDRVRPLDPGDAAGRYQPPITEGHRLNTPFRRVVQRLVLQTNQVLSPQRRDRLDRLSQRWLDQRRGQDHPLPVAFHDRVLGRRLDRQRRIPRQRPG